MVVIDGETANLSFDNYGLGTAAHLADSVLCRKHAVPLFRREAVDPELRPPNCFLPSDGIGSEACIGGSSFRFG